MLSNISWKSMKTNRLFSAEKNIYYFFIFAQIMETRRLEAFSIFSNELIFSAFSNFGEIPL